MSEPTDNVLLADKIANGETRYVPVPIRNCTIGADIGWLDATSSAP